LPTISSSAVVAAEQHYVMAQWATTRRADENVGYDILCIKGSAWLFVDVEGTRRDGAQVIITETEARHAHDNAANTELFILHDIEIDDIEGSGQVRIISEWDPLTSGTLAPITYYWRLPLGYVRKPPRGLARRVGSRAQKRVSATFLACPARSGGCVRPLRAA
jgi:hypothetical protein